MGRLAVSIFVIAAPYGAFGLKARGQATFSIQDLGTLPGGRRSIAFDINNSGDIVGESDFGGGSKTHGFLYHAGVMTDLGAPFGSASAAIQINSRGDIVLNSSVGGDVNYQSHPYLVSNGATLPIGPPEGKTVYAVGLNDHGQVVEQQVTPIPQQLLLYSDGQLNALEGFSIGPFVQQPLDINNNGQIIAWDGVNGYLHDPDGTVKDLGFHVIPKAINDAGDITGDWEGHGAFLYHDGQLTAIGAGFTGIDINKWGDVVGSLGNGNGSYVYIGGVVTNLNGIAAFGINDARQIVGSVTNSRGEEHAVLLNPLFPEPAALPFLISGLATLVRRRRAE